MSRAKGICSYCKTEIPKNSRSIKNHFSKCKSKPISNDSEEEQMLLLIEGRYNSNYWIVIKVNQDITLKKIDTFIRDIWVECCGHLSQFFNGDSKIGMSRRIDQVFVQGTKIIYEYDFGSPTELFLSLLEKVKDSNKKNIQVIMRNKLIEEECSFCENIAIYICPYCINHDEGLLCKSCIDTHRCVENEGEEILLPMSNSPRAGVCGYDNANDDVINKYFPNGII